MVNICMSCIFIYMYIFSLGDFTYVYFKYLIPGLKMQKKSNNISLLIDEFNPFRFFCVCVITEHMSLFLQFLLSYLFAHFCLLCFCFLFPFSLLSVGLIEFFVFLPILPPHFWFGNYKLVVTLKILTLIINYKIFCHTL